MPRRMTEPEQEALAAHLSLMLSHVMELIADCAEIEGATSPTVRRLRQAADIIGHLVSWRDNLWRRRSPYPSPFGSPDIDNIADTTLALTCRAIEEALDFRREVEAEQAKTGPDL